MGDEYCPECKQFTVIVDYTTGDAVCVECSLVLGDHCIDQIPEWRIFAADSGGDDGRDPNRVGGPGNPLLDDGSLQTFIANQNGGKAPRKLGLGLGSSERHNQKLVKGFESIACMSEHLGLTATSTIAKRACEIFKNVEAAPRRFNNGDAILAACLYISCKQEGSKRTLKEICSVSNGVMPKYIGRAEKYIAKMVPFMEVCGHESGSEMMSRFGSQLGLKFQAVKAAQEAVEKSQELDIRRTPASIAAAVIYMVAQLSGDKKSLKDISDATTVAQGTIRNSYKDLHPYVSKIVSTWFTQTLKV